MSLFSFFQFVLLLSVVFVSLSVHNVDEGYRGVYWIGGALQNYTTKPGFHFAIPFIMHRAQVQVSVQTDEVRNIACGTSGGVLVMFDKIEVVNILSSDAVIDTIRKYGLKYDQTLIYSKIHHEINQFCSRHSLSEVYISKFMQLDEMLAVALQRDISRYVPGLQIIATRVSKPRIPDKILKDYEEMERQRTQLLITTENQKVIEKNSETTKKLALISAEQEKEISKIHFQMKIKQQQTKQQLQNIEDSIHSLKEKALADSISYAQSRQSLSNERKLSPAYLQYLYLQKMRSVPKTFFTSNFIQVIKDNSFLPLGHLYPSLNTSSPVVVEESTDNHINDQLTEAPL